MDPVDVVLHLQAMGYDAAQAARPCVWCRHHRLILAFNVDTRQVLLACQTRECRGFSITSLLPARSRP
jgi:hypothetical protein